MNRHTPPKLPTLLQPDGSTITLPKPTLLIDTREQQPYYFTHFNTWFAGIKRCTLATGDYSIDGFQSAIAIERKSKADMIGSCSPNGNRTVFLRACERLAGYEFKALVVEASLADLLDGTQYSDLHPNALLGTLQALAVRWGIHPWFAESPALAEICVAQLIHKAYQLKMIEARGFPRRFRLGDI